MGKGQRNRELRAVEREANREALAAKAKKEKIQKWTISIVSIVLAICLVGGLTVHFITSGTKSSGRELRKAVVMESDHFKIDAAMMSYFFYSQYNQIVGSYSSYLESIGLNTSQSLKSQQCAFAEEGTTWYDYILGQATAQVKEILYLAENAKMKDLKISADDEKLLDETIASYKSQAASNGISEKDAFSAYFGMGVQEGDVREAMKLSLLADQYQTEFVDELDYTDKQIEDYYKKNINSYRYVDYYYYSVKASDTNNKSTYADAKKEAEKLAAVDSTKEFGEWVEAYMRKTSEITKDYTKESLEADIEDALSSMVYTGATYTKDNDASEWLFKKGKVGETYIADDGKGSYTVYYLTKAPYRETEITRSARLIVLNKANHDDSMDLTKEEAKKIIDEMKGADLTEEIFEAQAIKHSEDTATAAYGGLCENYKKSEYDPNVAKWLYAKDRNKGDMDLVKTESGYVLCYYLGEGYQAWQADCVVALKNDDYAAAKEKWEKDIKLTETEKNYNKIPDIV